MILLPSSSRRILVPLVLPSSAVTAARAEEADHSIRGKIQSTWWLEEGKLRLNITIPPNATARPFIPFGDRNQITEGGRSPEKAEGVKFLGVEEGRAVYGVDSGIYEFEAPWKGSN